MPLRRLVCRGASLQPPVANMSDTAQRPSFTWLGFRLGARAALVLLPTLLLYGFAFGVMAAAKGLSSLEAVLFSGLVYAGGAQMASLQAWSDPLPLLAICLTTAAMNARYLLMGATLHAWFAPLPAWQSYGSLFAMGDANWAMALRHHRAGFSDAAYLAGTGFSMWFVWIGATFAGQLFGALMGDPQRLGIDFLLAAFFAAVSVTFFRQGGATAVPLVVGVVVAIVVQALVPGPWYMMCGALAGCIAGGLTSVARS